MSSHAFKHVFGPVNSRRLGRSLGVDLIPLKTCSYDCIYCQLGRTTDKTIRRKAYVSLPAIFDEVERRLDCGPKPDYVTLSGSGEPTLHSHLGRLIEGLKKRSAVPVAILTNGSLLWRADLRDELKDADLVIPSLDAGNERLFKYVNRPDQALSFDGVVGGLEAFAGGYPGRVWLEVFVLGGVTAVNEEIDRIARIATRLGVEKIQLNAVARPPAEDFAFSVPGERLLELSRAFISPCEVVTGKPRGVPDPVHSATDEDILSLLRRRPCSSPDVAAGLSIPLTVALKHIDGLVSDGRVRPGWRGQYSVISRAGRDRAGAQLVRHAADSVDT